MLYQYGMRLGVDLLRRGKVRLSLPYLIRPVNYWRALEYRLVLEAAEFQPGQCVLDIGSPKLLSLYLAKKYGVRVVSTDIDDYFVSKYQYLREMERIPKTMLELHAQDGRRLSYSASSFDRIYSISVIEHIPDDGDSECMREIHRVLRPGGRCIITVPCWQQLRWEFQSANGFYWADHSKQQGSQVFYQRRYDRCSLFTRLIEPSGLQLKTLLFVGEKVMEHSDKEFSDFLPVISGPIQPLLSNLLHTAPVDDWSALKKPLCALIVLEKPAIVDMV